MKKYYSSLHEDFSLNLESSAAGKRNHLSSEEDTFLNFFFLSVIFIYVSFPP